MKYLKSYSLFENFNPRDYRQDYLQVLKRFITLPKILRTNRKLWILLEEEQIRPYVFFKPYIEEGDITLQDVNTFIQRKGFQEVIDEFFKCYLEELSFRDGLKKSLKQMRAQTVVDPLLDDLIEVILTGVPRDGWNAGFEDIKIDGRGPLIEKR